MFMVPPAAVVQPVSSRAESLEDGEIAVDGGAHQSELSGRVVS